MITIEMIINLLDKTLIRVWEEAGDNTVQCQIGDYWFYLCNLKEDECLENFATDEIAEMIFKSINNPEDSGLGDAEAEYYKCCIIEMTEN